MAHACAAAASGSGLTAADAADRLRVGADLVRVEEVAESIARFGDRYLRRVFTAHEVASCQGVPWVAAAGLAARFAAKEATIKVLRAPGPGPAWTSVEVRKDADGWCGLRLTGPAARLSDAAGISCLALSLTHEAGVGAAVVVAICGELDDV